MAWLDKSGKASGRNSGLRAAGRSRAHLRNWQRPEHLGPIDGGGGPPIEGGGGAQTLQGLSGLGRDFVFRALGNLRRIHCES